MIYQKTRIYSIIYLLIISSIAQCTFPGSSEVYLYSDSDQKIIKKPISSLQIGDYVLTKTHLGELQKSQVISWLYNDPFSIKNYLEIQFRPIGYNTTISDKTVDKTKMINLSSDHLIFVRSKNGWIAKRADRLAINDIVYLETWVAIVEKSEEKWYLGLYSPLTKDGSLLVNECWVSSHSFINNHEIADTLYRYYKICYDWMPPLGKY